VRQGVADLTHLLHPTHELRELLELRPLVVCGAHRDVDLDGLLNLRGHRSSSVANSPRSDTGRRRSRHGPEAVGGDPAGQATSREQSPSSWVVSVGATEHGDLVPQHKQLGVRCGAGAAHQQDQSEHLPEEQK
jgi:hypothetical protein